MNLLPSNPLFNLNDMFEDFFPHALKPELESGFFSPRVDIKEKDDKYEIRADLPGVEKENLSVTLEDGILTIEATTEEETSEEKEGKTIRRERRSGKYLRSFTVGNNMKESDIKASFKNGVLTLEAPKVKPHSSISKKIAIH